MKILLIVIGSAGLVATFILGILTALTGGLGHNIALTDDMAKYTLMTGVAGVACLIAGFYLIAFPKRSDENDV